MRYGIFWFYSKDVIFVSNTTTTVIMWVCCYSDSCFLEMNSELLPTICSWLPMGFAKTFTRRLTSQFLVLKKKSSENAWYWGQSCRHRWLGVVDTRPSVAAWLTDTFCNFHMDSWSSPIVDSRLRSNRSLNWDSHLAWSSNTAIFVRHARRKRNCVCRLLAAKQALESSHARHAFRGRAGKQ